MSPTWALALALMGLAQLLAGRAVWQGRLGVAALWGGAIALASLALTWRQMSPGVGLQPAEQAFLLGNGVAIALALMVWRHSRRDPAGAWARRGPVLALWLWNAACIGLLAWLTMRFRLFG